MSDDRVSCHDCRNLNGAGYCSGFGRRYEPSTDIARRCEQFEPRKNIADQRTGKERWPGLDGKVNQRAIPGQSKGEQVPGIAREVVAEVGRAV
jgi:hypothetical protein